MLSLDDADTSALASPGGAQLMSTNIPTEPEPTSSPTVRPQPDSPSLQAKT